eukprot:9128914-Alexandrium_andersonii.AAC.1
MSASLVGSEMCIRDRSRSWPFIEWHIREHLGNAGRGCCTRRGRVAWSSLVRCNEPWSSDV